jgi:glucose-6-phosphate 1-epimerase
VSLGLGEDALGASNIDDLNQRFGLNGIASVVAGNGGLPKVVVSAAEANGEMYLHGGHVTSWRPKGEREVLYLSPNSLFQAGYAIRGGIPVCFPWFGDKAGNPAAPAHGFVRTKEWQLASIELAGKDVAVSMSTQSDDDTRKWSPFDFRLICRATFGLQLKVELIATNTGASAFSVEEALHAYFAVANAETAFVRGLDGTRYIDKTDNRAEKMQTGDVRIAAETDRVYLDTTRELQLFNPTGQRSTTIEKQNSRTTVVWNPWSEKSAALNDLGAGEWKNFVCIETTNVVPFAVQLEPGQRQTMGMLVQVASS